MTQDEYTELKAHVDAVSVQDVHLGRVLSAIVGHLPGYRDAEQAKAEADAKAREEAAQAEAEAAPAEKPVPEATPVEEPQP